MFPQFGLPPSEQLFFSTLAIITLLAGVTAVLAWPVATWNLFDQVATSLALACRCRNGSCHLLTFMSRASRLGNVWKL